MIHPYSSVKRMTKTNEIKATRNSGNLGIVLRLESLAGGTSGAPFWAHIVLNRFVVDDDGNVCLTSPAGLNGILDAIDELKRELDDLGNQAVLWLAGSIASRRAVFSVVPDCGDKNTAGKDDGFVVSPSDSGPHSAGKTNVVSLNAKRKLQIEL